MRIPNEEKPHFSASQLICYLQCPLQYYFQYEEGLVWPTIPSAVSFGATIHKAIEELNGGLYMNDLMPLEQLTDDFVRYWTHEVEGNNIAWANADEPTELLIKGQELLTIYYNAFKEVRPRAVEKKFRVPILDPTTGSFVREREFSNGLTTNMKYADYYKPL